MYELTFITRVLALAGSEYFLDNSFSSGVKLFIATNASGGAGEVRKSIFFIIIEGNVSRMLDDNPRPR